MVPFLMRDLITHSLAFIDIVKCFQLIVYGVESIKDPNLYN